VEEASAEPMTLDEVPLPGETGEVELRVGAGGAVESSR
jgi:hypothetical protein